MKLWLLVYPVHTNETRTCNCACLLLRLHSAAVPALLMHAPQAVMCGRSPVYATAFVFVGRMTFRYTSLAVGHCRAILLAYTCLLAPAALPALCIYRCLVHAANVPVVQLADSRQSKHTTCPHHEVFSSVCMHALWQSAHDHVPMHSCMQVHCMSVSLH